MPRPAPRPLADRFWAKVAIVYRTDEPLLPDTTACWLWTGSLHGSRCGTYGQIKDAPPSRRTLRAHLVAYFLLWGFWPPKGLDVAHTCDTPACVNPYHLRTQPHRDNMLDYFRRFGRRPNGQIRSKAEVAA